MTTTWRDTHGFIDLRRLDLRRAEPELWMLLGEAESKCEHVSRAPLLPELSEQMHFVALVKGAQATTAIEGNTLTEDEVRDIARDQSHVPPSRSYQEAEVRNILGAFNGYLTEGPRVRIDREYICSLNEAVLRGLDLDAGIVPGRLRQRGVVVGRYRAPPHHDVPDLLDDFVQWANDFDADIPFPGRGIAWALLKAALAHLFFVWIHPFGDGNGRTARLLELNFLLAAGVPTPAAHLLSNHYNLTRDRYYRELDAARLHQNILGFVRYSMEGFVDGLRGQIDEIQVQQFEVLWARLVSERLPARTEAARRQQEVAIEMARVHRSVSKGEIGTLSIPLAQMYAGKTPKTVTRDLNVLSHLGLIVQVASRRYEVDRRHVLSLLPRTLA